MRGTGPFHADSNSSEFRRDERSYSDFQGSVVEIDSSTFGSVENTFEPPSGRSEPSTYFSVTAKLLNERENPADQSKYSMLSQ